MCCKSTLLPVFLPKSMTLEGPDRPLWSETWSTTFLFDQISHYHFPNPIACLQNAAHASPWISVVHSSSLIVRDTNATLAARTYLPAVSICIDVSFPIAAQLDASTRLLFLHNSTVPTKVQCVCHDCRHWVKYMIVLRRQLMLSMAHIFRLGRRYLLFASLPSLWKRAPRRRSGIHL